MIPQEIIEEIRSRASIEDIISRYVPSLKKKGKNYTGLCPFHKEKTPSFVVSPDKQIFHCFGCHAGGNVFSFISKLEHLTFPESVKLVGRLVGIDVPDNERLRDSSLEALYKANDYAMRLYNSTLLEEGGKPGLNYLLSRGIEKSTIEQFKLGFAPESWDFLTSRLKKHNVNLADMEKLGLVSGKDSKKSENSIHYFDKLRNRVIFPIFNQYDRTVGFGGRVIDDNQQPKYINSSESKIYHKRKILYGFNFAKGEISELNRVIIVEGYLDVIGCHQAGIKNVVAPLGTALTEEQVTLLSRHCNEIILLFDSDSAGIKAALRSLDLIKDFNLDVKVATLEEGDPFDCIIKNGVRALMMAVDSAMIPVEFKINRILANKNIDNSKKRLIYLFSIIKMIDFETERTKYLKKISFALDLDFNNVLKDFNTYVNSGSFSNETTEQSSKQITEEKDDFLKRSFKDLIVLLCNYPELITKAVLDVSETEISDVTLREIFITLGNKYSEGDNITIDRIFDYFTDDSIKKYLESILLNDFEVDNPDAAYTEIYLSIKLHVIDKKIDHFIDLIKNPDHKSNVTEYLTEIEIWRREKEKISDYLYNMHDQPHILD